MEKYDGYHCFFLLHFDCNLLYLVWDMDHTLSDILEQVLGPMLNIKGFNNSLTFVGKNETNNILENTTEIVSLLKKISPRCHDYLLKCVWGSKIVNCTDVSTDMYGFLMKFKKILTDMYIFFSDFYSFNNGHWILLQFQHDTSS